MFTIMRLTISVYLILIIQGCSVVQATSGPGSKDLSVLDTGTHRYNVLAELGQPVASEIDNNGNKIDIFRFKQGTHGAAKAGKALGYGILAVGTLGLSELVTSPMEGSLGKGAEMQLKVGYTADERVDEVVVLRDDRWVPIQELKEQSNEVESQ